MDKKKKLLMRALCVIMLAVICFSIPGALTTDAYAASDEEEALQMLSGKTAGVMTGTPQDSIILAKVPDAKIKYFNSAADLALALTSNKIDFMALPTVNYYTLAEQYKDLGYLDITFAANNVGTIFAKNNDKSDAIREQFNEYIAQLKESGKLEEMQEYWLYPHEWENIDIPKTGENGTLTMAATSSLKPFSFKLNEQPVGYEIDIAAGFCREYGYGLKVEDLDFSGILGGITTGRYDFAASQISWTEERDKSVNFSDFYYTQIFVPIVRASEFEDSPLLITAEDSSSSDDGQTVLASLGNSIRRTLVDEDRWESVLQGLLVTVVITFAGFILANLLGALFCAMNMSKSRILKIIAGIYSKLMQGLPVVVILMILYYIVFGQAKISNILVAVIGFGLVFGAYMAQLFEGGISGVEKGQREAALASGFTKRQTFMGIVLPQAIRTMLPGYFSNLISLMKGTAVVGYIAVNDLTKVGDIIRSNTYEAFVPLLAVAIIYFAIAVILIVIMNRIRKKLEPKRMKKKEEKTAEKESNGGETA